MEIDIECNDGKCPICGSNVGEDIYDKDCFIFCKNGCFRSDEYCTNDGRMYISSFYIFDELFDYNSDDTEDFKRVVRERVVLKIKHWKENEKYLMRIMINE